MGIAFCLGCGCSDHDACENAVSGETCSWLVVDYAYQKGICSECPEHMPIWPQGYTEKGEGEQAPTTKVQP